MEGSIRRLDGVKNAKIDFASGRLTIEIEDRGRVRQITEEAEKIIKGIESHVEVIDERKIKGHMDAREEKAEEGGVRKEVIRLVAGSVLLIIPTIFKFNFYLEFAMFFISYLLVGCEVLTKAVRNIARGEVFDENFLMTIATIGAFVIGEFPEGVAVMLFYQIGEMFQDMAVNRSRKSISALMDIRPDYANLKLGDDVERVSPEEVEAGDIILVKPGERIPLDGVVIDGKSMVDTSALTGESLPREVIEGDEVLGGFINKNGALTVRVTKEFGESTVSKILDLVQNASSRKAKTENFITKFARYYTPAVVFTALVLAAIPPIVLPGARFSDWFYRALIFLVISCPCALVVSIPLGFFGGIGGASRNGILVKGSNYLEALNYVDTVVFDKTGTLTKGVFNVTEVNPADGIGKDELLRFAALCESHSNHPIALSILKAYGEEINKEDIESYEEIPGYGIKVFAGGREILAGNAKLMKMKNISFEEVDAAGTIVNVAVDGKYAGHIIISDEIKEDSERAIRSLKALGVKRTVMLTGDVKSVGEKVASGLGIDEVFAELLPHEKVERVEELSKKEGVKGKIAFVGDGINDAPVLARADVGIAMGGLGSDAAIEAADVVIMTDEPSKVAGAIGIARRTRRIVWQNIIFALGVKLFVLLLGALGMASMWAAVFADVGVALIAVLNAMRVLNVRDV
ncbi:Cd2+/Zn2+-exporting ATPase [Fonticella tunisiensis]|uniref:Cd2+/Zn2+-exporting ATPase n=1 Tax=Fonticella tunisiensis TaxID=1096341 RepID=A0A4R7KQH4_9CLOT|nr:Cd2+/Zn2+-exporting ATPase [Fonticella tunisiensis]